MDKKPLQLNPDEIIITSKGSVLYKGRDISKELNLSQPTKISSTNMACTNASLCAALNMQCENGPNTAQAVNIGFCVND
jgi:hypothetical protein